MIRWTLFGVIGAALLAGVGYALWHSPPDPAGRQIPFNRIEHPPLPAYVPATFLAEVRALGRFPEVLDTGQSDLPARLGMAFARHPWVEKVERVQVLAPGRVRAELRFRTPAARIAHEGRTFLLDRHGVILPPISDGSSHLLEIRGVRTAPAGLPGQRWGDPAVETAAEVAADLEPVRVRLRLAAIVIGPDPLQADLRLETHTRTQVLWRTLDGRADQAVDRKLKLLHEYLREAGPEDTHGPYLLDVRSGVTVLRQPLRE